MKPDTRISVAVALATLSLLGHGSPAWALTTEAGVACTGAQYGPTFGPLICPIVRVSEVPAGQSFGVFVDGVGNTVSSTCTLYSYSYGGALLGSASVPVPAGTFDLLLRLPATQVPPYSAQSLYCTLDSNSLLIGYTPTW